MPTNTITIRADSEVARQVAELAKAMDRSRTWVIEEALRQYIATQAWQIEGIREAQASLVRGEGIPFEQVMEEMEALIQSSAGVHVAGK
jgi:predicted transcriptional regulator